MVLLLKKQRKTSFLGIKKRILTQSALTRKKLNVFYVYAMLSNLLNPNLLLYRFETRDSICLYVFLWIEFELVSLS